VKKKTTTEGGARCQKKEIGLTCGGAAQAYRARELTKREESVFRREENNQKPGGGKGKYGVRREDMGYSGPPNRPASETTARGRSKSKK